MSEVSFEHVLTHIASHDLEHTKKTFDGKTVDEVPVASVLQDIPSQITLVWEEASNRFGVHIATIRHPARFDSKGPLVHINPGSAYQC